MQAARPGGIAGPAHEVDYPLVAAHWTGDEFSPQPPMPEDQLAGPDPLPLEDDTSTEEKSTDTQLSSSAPHPGYPWEHFNSRLHGAPIVIPDRQGEPSRAEYVAFDVDGHMGEPQVYATLGGEQDRHIFPL